MQIDIILEDQRHPVQVADDFVIGAEDFLQKMDADMDNGWQMSRVWVDRPTNEQRCQIVTDKLLTAMENEDILMQSLMAAYLLSRMPGIAAIEASTNGEIQETRFILDD